MQLSSEIWYPRRGQTNPPKCFMKFNFSYFQHYSTKLVVLAQIHVHFLKAEELLKMAQSDVTKDDVTKTSNVNF